MYRFFIILFFTALIPAELYSQSTEEFIREIINEKLHHNDHGSEVSDKVQTGLRSTAAYETQISSSEDPESEIHAAINPTDSNNIVVCPMKLVRESGYTKTVYPIFYTKDFGETWQESSFEPFPNRNDVEIRGGGDPVLAFDADGILYLSWIHLYKSKDTFDTAYWGLHWAWSTDGGANWSQSSNDKIGYAYGTPYTSDFSCIKLVHDKQWMAVDQSQSIYRNTLYVAYLKADLTQNQYHIALKKKLSLTNTFDTNEIILSNNISNVQFAGIDVDDSGMVHVIFVSNKSTIWYTSSSDGGSSFKNPVIINSFTLPDKIEGIKDGSSSRLYPASQILIDKSASSPYYGNIYITYTATEPNQDADSARGDIFLIRSVDRGKTWNLPVKISYDQDKRPRDQFYSSLSINQNGTLSVAYFDAYHSDSMTRNDAVNFVISKSTDGGNNFSDPLIVSSQASDFQNAGLKNSGFGIGEYTQVVSTNGHVFPVWSDGRKNDGDLDVYIGKIDLYRFSSLEEISVLDASVKLNRLYPNPALDHIFFEMTVKKSTQLKASIFDLNNKLVSEKFYKKVLPGKTVFQLELDGLPKAAYFLRLETDFGYFLKRFIIAI